MWWIIGGVLLLIIIIAIIKTKGAIVGDIIELIGELINVTD